MTLFNLFAAAARAGSAAPQRGGGLPVTGVLRRQQRHHLSRRAAHAVELRHHAHGAVDVGKKPEVARTQSVDRGFALTRCLKAVLGAFAVAGKAHQAGAALLR